MAEARDPVVVLTYQGDEEGHPYIPGIPARDLTDHDIASLVFADDRFAEVVEGDTGMTRQRMTTDDRGFEKAAKQLVSELTGRKLYAAVGGPKKAVTRASDVPAAPEAEPTPLVGGEVD